MIKVISSNELKQNNTAHNNASSDAIRTDVASIIENVKRRGDDALREYTERFDGCAVANFELDDSAIEKAISMVDPDFIGILKRAAKNIEDYHLNQIRTGFDLPPKNGVILGQKVTPIARVACYIPGGSAPYPSSVLMNLIPAKIAGVNELIIATPPSNQNKASQTPANKRSSAISACELCNGVDPLILAAARIAGVDRVFTIGGAQAIAALAFGTESVPRVDKITGPGNAFVTEAKRQVFGIVGIDMLAGPSDILIIADKNTNPVHIAADMLSQCEHFEGSKAVLVTDSIGLVKKVKAELKTQLGNLPRRDIAKKNIDENSMIITVDSLEEAFDVSNMLAPEHLEVLLDEPFNYLSKIVNAGSIFLGKHTPETFGDYLAGPNHVLPTEGTAKFSSPLSVDDFIKKSSYTYFTKEALHEYGADAMRFARAEGFEAHAQAVEKRLTDRGSDE